MSYGATPAQVLVSASKLKYALTMFRIIHLSDIHLGPMPPIAFHKLLSKRMTGYINWQRNRAKTFSPKILEQVLTAVHDLQPDHIVITGDLINIGLDEEISRITHWLNQLGPPDKVSIIGGNHDAYIRGSLESALAAWAPYLQADNGISPQHGSDFPVVRRRGPYSIILMNSAVPTPPFNATGLAGTQQLAKLGQILEQEAGHIRLLLIHHPPIHGVARPRKELRDIDALVPIIQRHGVELILHGHTHLWDRNVINSPRGEIPVVGVSAAGQSFGGRKPAAGFNVFEVDPQSEQRQLSLIQYSLVDDSNTIKPIHRETLQLPNGLS